MYKIIMLQEIVYAELYFFHETDRKSINSDVLFYAGQAVGSRKGGGIGSSCSQWCSYILLCACVCVCVHVWVKGLKGIRQVTGL